MFKMFKMKFTLELLNFKLNTSLITLEEKENLEVERYLPENLVIDENLDNIDKIVKKFQYHPSIVMINENVKIEEKFEFKDITDDKMFKKISHFKKIIHILEQIEWE